MKLSAHSHALLKSTLKEALKKFVRKGSEQNVITDIHLLPRQGSGELIIFDDDDEVLSKTIIEEWIENTNDDFYENVERILRTIITREKEDGTFDNLSILTPYSFVLIDEDKETLTEILLIDDDTVLVNDELLKGLDDELDDFLKELLKI